MARTKLAVALVLAGAITATSAHALGLGAIEVKSALNQPLDARIPLLPADEGELEALSVSLASAAAFQRAGVDRPFSLTRLRFTVVRGDQPYVHVTTEQPVKEPFLDFLVQADWNRGRLVREFTLLLDPPIYGGSSVAPVVRAAPASRVQQPTGAVAQAATPAVATAGVAEVSPAAVGSSGRSYGPVGGNDTLWKIANELRPADSVSVNQVMIALLRANPDAFIDGDINRLRRGSVLQLPELEQIAAIDGARANQEVRAQMQRWRQANVAAQPRGRLQVVAPPEQNAADSDAAKPEQAAADHAAQESLRQELQGYRESNISLQAENEELKAQVEGLKQELAHFERLLSLSVQQPVAAEADPLAEPLETLEPAAAEAPEPAQPTASEQPAAEEAAKPAAAPKPAPVIQEVKEPGFFDDPSNLINLGGIGAALLGVLYLLLRRRRKAAEDEELEAAIAMPDAEAELQDAEAGMAEEPHAEAEEAAVEAAAMAGDTDLLDADDDLLADNDPLSEAEVYLAYSHYDQARELLENALEQEPERADLRLKLLETLALVQDEDSFIIHARLLHSQVGDNDEAWQRAREMGRDFLPDEGLFAAPSPVQAAAPIEDVAFDLDFDLDRLEKAAPEAAELPPAAAAQPETDDFSLDFELPELQTPQAISEPAIEEAASADALDGLERVETTPLAEAGDLELSDLSLGEPALAAGGDNVLDFTLPEDEQVTPEPTAELDDLDGLDEAGIKLNLARAYLDMGDSDGARSLIDEVIAEGNSSQRQEAEGLLQQLA